jgi:hypothetical protein
VLRQHTTTWRSSNRTTSETKTSGTNNTADLRPSDSQLEDVKLMKMSNGQIVIADDDLESNAASETPRDMHGISFLDLPYQKQSGIG